jgi:antitoxin component of MazEF toxin-antitoxin module
MEHNMLTVKTAKRDYIAVPENLLEKIGAEEGDTVDVRVNKGTLVITKEKDDFLALEGALKDVDIERPIKDLIKWKPRNESVIDSLSSTTKKLSWLDLQERRRKHLHNVYELMYGVRSGTDKHQ